MFRTITTLTGIAALGLSLGGCGTFEKLSRVGTGPKLTEIQNPVIQPGYRPVSMPMPVPEPASYNPNSLWRNGSRAFFKDQRAANVGDILTVLVEITDKAQFDNTSGSTRDGSENLGVGEFFGLKGKLQKALPGVDPSAIVNLSSKSDTQGDATIDRQEKVTTKVAAVVTQKLPNGNLVIEGRQEVRVNKEVRDLIVAGVARPEDVSSENTIPISKIAEARVSYGGRGRHEDVQQPRYGQQIIDAIAPF